MGKILKTPEDRALFQEWNQRLVESGHNEIEDFSRDEPMLKDWSSRWNKPSRRHMLNEQIERYYEMAEIVLNTYPFRNKEHKRVWELHARGASLRKIAREMNQKKFKKSNIYIIITTIELTAGLRRG